MANDKFRFVIEVDHEGPNESREPLYLMTGTLIQCEALILALDILWETHDNTKKVEKFLLGFPQWFRPIAEVWDGCEILALDENGDAVFYFTGDNVWEKFLNGEEEPEGDLEIPSEDMP